jgi:hypothetical protein
MTTTSRWKLQRIEKERLLTMTGSRPSRVRYSPYELKRSPSSKGSEIRKACTRRPAVDTRLTSVLIVLIVSSSEREPYTLRPVLVITKKLRLLVL